MKMGEHECPTCGRDDFSREVDMKAHHTIAHGESLVSSDDPVKCPMCGRDDFESIAGMRAHHKLVHAESISDSRNLVESTRQKVIQRDNHTCQRCGINVSPTNEDGPDFQVHHIIPRAAGGPDHEDNLVTLCNECHSKVHRLIENLPEERPDLLDELRAIVCNDGG